MKKLPTLFFVYLTPRKKMLTEFQEGREQSTFLYGLPELQKLGFKVGFSDIAYSEFNFLRHLIRPLELLQEHLLNYRLGFRLHVPLLLWPKFRNYDIVLCTQESVGLPFSFLKRVGIIKNKIIYFSSNLTNGIEMSQSKIMLNFIRDNLKSCEAVVCSSRKEQEILEEFLSKPVHFLPDGIDIDFFTPQTKTNPKIDILAVGRDLYRDFATLFKAVTDTSWKTIVVCTPDNIRCLTIPKNVKIMQNISSQTLRQLYDDSKIVVLPMKKTNKPQGHTVLMGAMAMYKPIIASDVPGINTSYALENYPAITLVPAENTTALKSAIKKTLMHLPTLKAKQNARGAISTAHYARRLSNLITSL